MTYTEKPIDKRIVCCNNVADIEDRRSIKIPTHEGNIALAINAHKKSAPLKKQRTLLVSALMCLRDDTMRYICVRKTANRLL